VRPPDGLRRDGLSKAGQAKHTHFLKWIVHLNIYHKLHLFTRRKSGQKEELEDLIKNGNYNAGRDKKKGEGHFVPLPFAGER
jgi:hypothetical protein